MQGVLNTETIKLMGSTWHVEASPGAGRGLQATFSDLMVRVEQHDRASLLITVLHFRNGIAEHSFLPEEHAVLSAVSANLIGRLKPRRVF